MRANEFIKKYGISVAKKNTEKCFDGKAIQIAPLYMIEDLKRYVDAYELVEKCGGVESLKSWLNYEKRKIDLSVYFHCNKPPILLNIETAEKAITLVEECQ